MKMIFKQSNLIIALSIGLQLQSGNASAFDLSDVTNAVDQVNSVAKQLNAPQSEPTAPTPIPPPQAFPVTTVKTEASNPSSYVFHHAPPEDISDWAEATSYEEYRIGAECLAYHVLMNSKHQDCSARPSFPNTLDKKVI